jgi:nitroreductase
MTEGMRPSARLVPLSGYAELSEADMRERASAFLEQSQCRRTVRDFSDRPVPRDIIEMCVLAAGTAPNGAHRQPWRFVIVSDPEIKRRIRLAAEDEEKEFYAGRAPDDWLEALAPLGTDETKPFLERAPYLIVVFAESYAVEETGEKTKNYYVTESVGIATGLLVTAIHTAGLVSLTHTPSPMGFLNEILGRPENERAFLILVVGHPAQDATVPELQRKPLDEIATFIE